MRRGGKIDRLPGQDLKIRHCMAQTLEMRQVRVQVEPVEAVKQPKTIQLNLDLDRRGRPVLLGFRPESMAVLDRNAETGEQRARQTSEALLRGNCPVSMMQERGRLQRHALVVGEIVRVADVVVRTNEGDMAGFRQPPPLRWRPGRFERNRSR